jgi:hypothetical protein
MSNIADVAEGHLADSMRFVFEQLADMGCKAGHRPDHRRTLSLSEQAHAALAPYKEMIDDIQNRR